jgi:4-aminobutyrate aminotransferase
MFAWEESGAQPDILVLAKGLASGFPLSAVVASRALMSRWRPGSHGGTYGGNAVACAAAVATIAVLQEEELVANAARLGPWLQAALRGLQARYPVLGDVRGRGLMVGCEFTTPGGEPDAATTKAVQKACLAAGLLLLTCGTYDNVIHWVPPLLVTQEQLAEGLDIFAGALTAVTTATAPAPVGAAH